MFQENIVMSLVHKEYKSPALLPLISFWILFLYACYQSISWSLDPLKWTPLIFASLLLLLPSHCQSTWFAISPSHNKHGSSSNYRTKSRFALQQLGLFSSKRHVASWKTVCAYLSSLLQLVSRLIMLAALASWQSTRKQSQSCLVDHDNFPR